MSEPHDGPDGTEAISFTTLLHKMIALEHAMKTIPPLLKKIIDHLEAQGKQPEVPVATYAQLYPMLEAQKEESAVIEATAAPVPTAPPRKRRAWHWFVKEVR